MTTNGISLTYLETDIPYVNMGVGSGSKGAATPWIFIHDRLIANVFFNKHSL